jgi:hypothetical protein
VIDIKEAKKALAVLEEAQAKIGDMKQYIDLPYEEMYVVYRLMKPKQAEKFIEDWVANLIGGKKINKREAPEKYAKNDLGDIQLSKSSLKVGVNNIELKVSFRKDSDLIGGGQLRMFEPVAGYMFFKAIDETKYEMFLLTKDQLVNEIKQRANDSGKAAFCSSQGSNDIKGSNELRLKRLDENVAGKRMDKIGWDFNMKTENEYYQSFKAKYQVTPEQLKTKHAV